MSAAPPVHTAASRALLAWVDRWIDVLDVDEMPTADRGRLEAFRSVRRELVDRLPYVEAEAICIVYNDPSMTQADATDLLGLYDTEAPIDLGT